MGNKKKLLIPKHQKYMLENKIVNQLWNILNRNSDFNKIKISNDIVNGLKFTIKNFFEKNVKIDIESTETDRLDIIISLFDKTLFVVTDYGN